MTRPRLSTAESRAIRDGLRSIWLLAGLVLIAGAALDIPALVPVSLLIGTLALAREIWLRRGMQGLEYHRALSTRHAVWGDEVALTVTVRNRSWLPVAWLTAEDRMSEPVAFAGGAAVRQEAGGEQWLRNAWTLWPFERVERTFRLDADHRGRVAFGPVHLEVADLFAGSAAEADLALPFELTIAPRSLPVRMASRRSRWTEQQRAVAGFPEDPSQFAGVRPYQPGDSMRRIHWRATARTGSPRTKRFDASRERMLVVALDIQTVPGRTIGSGYDPELVEALCVTAAALLRDGISAGSSCGLAAAAYSYRPQAEVRIHPAAGHRQLLSLMDVLARLSPYPSGQFSTLLGALPRWLPPNCQLSVVSARDLGDHLGILRRLRSLGYDIGLVAVGRDGPAVAASARAAGIRAQVAELTPDWRTADALTLAG